MCKNVLLVAAWCSILALVPVASAQHHDDEEGHGKPAEFVMPTTYEEGVEEIEHRLHEISELMESGELDQVHAQANVIQKIGKVLGQLALKKDSGVPRQAIREINLVGKELAAKFDAIDKAGDSGDLAGTRKIYHQMMELAETLEKHLPKVYACPMECEGDKTYSAAGRCPKCGMPLKEVKAHTDHEARHGGVFFMTPDKKHHLEGALSGHGGLRIYFYDEYTKPILADRFTAEGTIGKQGADAEYHRALEFSLDHEKAFLAASVSSYLTPPLSAKVFIDFKDGKEPQVFDFDFDEYSKESAKDHDEHEEDEHDEHDEHEDDEHDEHEGHGQ